MFSRYQNYVESNSCGQQSVSCGKLVVFKHVFYSKLFWRQDAAQGDKKGNLESDYFTLRNWALNLQT